MTLVATSALMAVFFAYSYSARRQLYLLFWSAAWGLLAVHYAGPIAHIWLQNIPWSVAIELWMLAAASLMFFLSAQLYAHAVPKVYAIVAAAFVLAVWSVAFSTGQTGISPTFGVTAVILATAWVFWRESRKRESLSDRGLAVALLFWGALGLGTSNAINLDGSIRDVISALAVLPLFCMAVLMSMTLYADDKSRVESNMLALSNLNLATSGLVGNDVQKMIAQALGRILSVVQVPRGALFLHHGDPQGPTCVVAEGFSDTFCSTSMQEGLDDHLVNLVMRLGGLAVFNDLHHGGDWEALDKDEAFRRFRQLAISQGLRTVAAITLQTKENAFGVLLLGASDNRRFGSGELRLLLALGHQIGMAVENSYLVQQTARRSDELHILNEIGRTLSSTLDTDTVFDKIYVEMQRLFDASNLYIAFWDPDRNVLRFEIEIQDGVRVPKRERPAGDHLSEYVIRTRQALLIRENFAESMQRLGVDPVQQRGCFCGVPLVRHDRAIGLIAVHSQRERVYDAGHLELMRVLASEATIALENARLFRKEQTKSRHLTLLNNVSRNAIATLNPDEMLTRIASELELGLTTYDHIGIGVLDYADKEIVIQAEAGARKQALGRRIALGEGLVGRVARAGEMMVVPNFVSNGGAGSPVLEDSVSGAALPIYYSDHLHGVLYVETSKEHAFPDEELQVLSTLADLISGALHNALTFQRAQEQAITDGLTGVKTHRFFMETLSSEWKRATRAGRAFSVVLIDLDRFKFVNDFYGHLEGDLVLQRISQILEQTCRRSDVVARYGGDEFVILMPETNVEQARQLASKLRASICADPLLHDKNITGSFGIASFPVHGSTPQELIQVADASMYVSKHQGGNAVSTAEHLDPDEAKRWKRDVLEGYLNVTLKRPLDTGPDALEDICKRLEQFTRSVGDTAGAAPQTGKNAAALPPAVAETLTAVVASLDAKDPCTEGHSQKVAAYAGILAEALGMPAAQVEEIRLAALLHDIGKIGIPDAVIQKSGPLDPAEWELMQQHVRYGARILQPFPEIAAVREMVEHHHEFFDGSGYPDGLSGEAISLGARILALCDAYDTITSERSYQRGRGAEEAFTVLERCSGAQFDPQLVEAFIAALRKQSLPLIEATPVPVTTDAS